MDGTQLNPPEVKNSTKRNQPMAELNLSPPLPQRIMRLHTTHREVTMD